MQRQSVDHGLPPAVKPRVRRTPRFWVACFVAVMVGSVAASALGTALHGQFYPLGAVAALVLSGSIAVFVGAWFRSVWPTAAAGILTYVLTGVVATSGGTSSLIVTGSGWAELPPVAVAGNLWIFGQAVVGILAVVVVSLVLRTGRRRRRA